MSIAEFVVLHIVAHYLDPCNSSDPKTPSFSSHLSSHSWLWQLHICCHHYSSVFSRRSYRWEFYGTQPSRVPYFHLVSFIPDYYAIVCIFDRFTHWKVFPVFGTYECSCYKDLGIGFCEAMFSSSVNALGDLLAKVYVYS